MCPLEDVGLGAEAGRVSAAIRPQVGVKDVTERGHEQLQVAGRHAQRAGREGAGALSLATQELALRGHVTASTESARPAAKIHIPGVGTVARQPDSCSQSLFLRQRWGPVAGHNLQEGGGLVPETAAAPGPTGSAGAGWPRRRPPSCLASGRTWRRCVKPFEG